MQLRIAENTWKHLHEQLFARTDVESAGLLLCEPLLTTSGTIIVVRDALIFGDDAYRVRHADQLSIDPVAMNRMTRPARDRGWSVFTIHNHPGASEPWFSAADDDGDARLMPSLSCQIPDVMHGSIVVIDDGSAVARIFSESGGKSEPIPMRVVGRSIIDPEPAPKGSEPWFARQELALGARGQSRLRQLRVGVIGLGGIGSLVTMQLAHLGVGGLVLIDGDVVEASNLSRVAASTKEDTGHEYKADVAARYARTLGLVPDIDARREFLTTSHVPLLGSCDVIVSCVDQHTPRAILNRLAYEHLVPVIDLGTAFRVDSEGAIVGDAGRVVVIGPGRPCLGCWGHIDANALRTEALPDAEREELIEAGYIQGATEAQPSVIAFNALVAGAGVVELLRLVTAFAGTESPPLRLAFSFSEGTVRRNTLSANRRCRICGNHTG